MTDDTRPHSHSASAPTEAREVYASPKITFVKLAVEQSLMGSCKSAIVSGPLGVGCPSGAGVCQVQSS